MSDPFYQQADDLSGPTDYPVDFPVLLVFLMFLSILSLSMILWIRQILRAQSGATIERKSVSDWPIGWINFGIFTSVLLALSVLVQHIGVALSNPSPVDSELPRKLTPSLAIFAVLLTQIPMLLGFYFMHYFYLRDFLRPLSSVSLSPVSAFFKTVPLFIMYCPIIWVASLFWVCFLMILRIFGWIDEIKPQELIIVFQNGGDPLAIGLLVIFAVLLAPIVEELIFRGCIYRFFKSKTRVVYAQIAAACLFSMVHANLSAFVPLFVIGILLSRVYERSGSILTPICFHALYNGLTLFILFLENSSNISIQ